MKKYVYPAVVYYDEDNAKYVMQIEELGLVTEGSTMEEAHEKMSWLLQKFTITSIMYDMDIPAAQNYSMVQSNNINYKVLLVDCVIDDTKIKRF